MLRLRSFTPVTYFSKLLGTHSLIAFLRLELIEELRQKHGTLAAVAPLPRAHFTKPNIVIKPNANSRPTGDTTGYLANPEEV